MDVSSQLHALAAVLPGKGSGNAQIRRLTGLKNWYGHFGEKKNIQW
jgi:hypothetical protein